MIRIKGRLGPTALSAFPTMVSELKGGETVLTGLLEDRSAVFGALGQMCRSSTSSSRDANSTRS